MSTNSPTLGTYNPILLANEVINTYVHAIIIVVNYPASIPVDTPAIILIIDILIIPFDGDGAIIRKNLKTVVHACVPVIRKRDTSPTLLPITAQWNSPALSKACLSSLLVTLRRNGWTMAGEIAAPLLLAVSFRTCFNRPPHRRLIAAAADEGSASREVASSVRRIRCRGDVHEPIRALVRHELE